MLPIATELGHYMIEGCLSPCITLVVGNQLHVVRLIRKITNTFTPVGALDLVHY